MSTNDFILEKEVKEKDEDSKKIDSKEKGNEANVDSIDKDKSEVDSG